MDSAQPTTGHQDHHRDDDSHSPAVMKAKAGAFFRERARSKPRSGCVHSFPGVREPISPSSPTLPPQPTPTREGEEKVGQHDGKQHHRHLGKQTNGISALVVKTQTQLTRRGAEDETTRPTKIPVPVSAQHSHQTSPRSSSAPARPRAQPDESHQATAKSLVRKSSFKLERARSTSDLGQKMSVHWDTDLDTDEEKEENRTMKKEAATAAAAGTASRSSDATGWLDLGLSLIIGLANVVVSGVYGALTTLGRWLTIKNFVLMLLFCAGILMLVDWLSANPLMHYIVVSVIRGAWMVMSSVTVSIFRFLMFKVPRTGDHDRSPPQQHATAQLIKTATAIPLPPMHVPRLFPAQDNHHHQYLYGEDEQVGLTSVYGTAMLDLLGVWLPGTLWWQGQSTLKDREVINSMRSKFEVATGEQGQMMMVTSQAAAYIHAETQAGGAVHTAWHELSELLAETRYLTGSSSSEYKLKMMLLGSCTIGDLGWQVQLGRATRLERAIKTLQGVTDHVVELASKRKSVKNQKNKEAADTGRGVLHGPTQQILRDILRHCEAASGLLAGKDKSAAWDRAMGIELGAGRSTAREMGLSWQLSMQDECREMLAWWNGMAGLEETLASVHPPGTQTQILSASVNAMVVRLASGLEDARTRGLVEGPWWRVWWRVLSGCRPHHDNGDIGIGNGPSWQQASVNGTRWAEIRAIDQRLLQWTEKLMAAVGQALKAGEMGK